MNTTGSRIRPLHITAFFLTGTVFLWAFLWYFNYRIIFFMQNNHVADHEAWKIKPACVQIPGCRKYVQIKKTSEWDDVVVHYWLTARRVWFQHWPLWAVLCGVGMFSLCQCGFSPGTPASSHCLKTCTLIGYWSIYITYGCECVREWFFVFVSPVMNYRHIQGEPCLRP